MEEGHGCGPGAPYMWGWHLGPLCVSRPATPVAHRVLCCQAGDLTGALETLLAAEKKTRVGGDSTATAQIATLMLDLCWEARNLDQLNAQILILCKRRAQSTRVRVQ